MSVSDLLAYASPRSRPARADNLAIDGALGILGAVGAALAIAGWIDWGLLWVPLRFGVVEWEFGTISSSFDALPLATIGTAAVAAAAVGAEWQRTQRVVAVLAWVVAGAFVLVFGVYALDLPVLLKDATGEIRPVIFKAVTKTSLYALLYTTTYIWIGRACWRGARRTWRRK